MISKFPEIATITEEFIKQHGFAAQCHRRTDTGNSFGVTAAQIRDHLYNSIPGLKEHCFFIYNSQVISSTLSTFSIKRTLQMVR